MRTWISAAVLACLGIGNVQAQTVFKVGTGIDCTHATVQSAIDAAGSDGGQDSIIHISNSLAYTAQALTIRDQNLSLFGGFARCSDNTPTASALTRLDGAGGSARSVLSVTGRGNLHLRSLEIRGGDASDSAFGGGVFMGAEGTLFIEQTHIANNRAGFGGGIAVYGARTLLAIGSNVLVFGNTARREGGGIHCRAGRLEIKAPGSGLLSNHAEEEGGGLRLVDCDAQLASAGPFNAGVLYGNSSNQNGGGISASDSGIEVFTIDPVAPVRVSLNVARHRGGGVALFDHSRLTVWDGIFEGNRGYDGGAVYAYARTIGGPHFAVFSASTPPAGTAVPSGARACASGLRCNRFVGNVARRDDGTPGAGAVFYSDYTPPSCFPGVCFDPIGSNGKDFDRIQLDRNEGRSLIRHVGKSHRFRISNCLVFGNTVSEDLLSAPDANPSLELSHCTISHNQVGGAVLRTQRARVRCSILNQPGVLLAGSTGNDFIHLLVPDTSQLPPKVSIARGVPRFVDPPRDDYRLFIGSRFEAPSPGLDFADACGEDATNADLDGRQRPVDLVNRPNQLGPIDLGAHESRPDQGLPIGS